MLLKARGLLDSEPDGYFQRAIRSWNTVLKLDPELTRVRMDLHDFHLFLAENLQAIGRPDEANAHRQAARRLRMERPDRK